MAPSASTTANVPAPGVPYFTPKQDPPVGTALHPETAPTLFQPLTMRHMTLQNRFVVSPMCQYSAEDGHHTDWHFAHLSQFVLRGNALTIVEATAVTANGRITPQDSGLWKDSQIEPLRRTVTFAHSQGQKIGIQLAHAGRKASTVAPWVATHTGTASAIAPAEDGELPHPKEMTRDDIKELVQAFRDAAARAVQAGFDMIEIHGAHGYLLTSFLSPLSNRRTDEYGGSFENRTRLLFQVIQAVRDWMEWAGEPSWCVQDSLRLAKMLPEAGVDLLDVSSGGNNSQQKIQISTYYQVDIAGQVREEVQKAGLKLLIGAVGLITSAEMARSIVQEKPADNGDKPPECGAIEVEQEAGLKTQADVVLMARQLLREPEFPLKCAFELGVEVKWPNQYARSNWRAHRH
ncbi:NADH:flavin oxidoreductase/NADH oxidase [Apiospora hydei]|uniref:NADH:flavin oxidoreductase/NADH oxidase n=1 Tax=Apiospora hydei TaxID=1337664 RepID=A0ABR1X113_9PEZI